MSASPRVQELSSQNAKLSERLAVICKENSNLTAEVSSLQNTVAELTKAPFQKDSVLSQMFDQEKAAGWFSSSKNGAKEQLQKLCDALQKEYVEYKTTHTHSDKEMETYMKKLQAAQNKSAELASLLREQNGGDGDLKNLQRQLEEKKSEVSRLQKELQTQRMAGSGGGTGSSASGGGGASLTELRQARDEAERLKQELEAVKTALATQEGLHSMKAKESEELQRKMDVLRTQHREEILALKKKDEEGKKNQKGCSNCALYTQQLEDLRARSTQSQEELTRLRSQIADTASVNEKKYATLESKLMETQSALEEKTLALSRSVPQVAFEELEMEKKKLLHESSLLKDRISHMETIRRNANSNNNSGGDGKIDDEEILEALERYKERICTAEFEKEELLSKVQKLETALSEMEASKNEEQRQFTEDRQRVSFLLKKCANLGAGVRKLQTEKDALAETLLNTQAELQRSQHQLEAIPPLQEKIDSLTQENQKLEDRLAATAEMEESLVKAKETIAYMELAQSSSISLAQYAELQSQKQKLEHLVKPLQTQLEEAQQQVLRLTEEKRATMENASEHSISVENLKDELDGLKENEKILMEKLTHYKEENHRLTTLNTSLDAQMTNMQSGIAEMAMHMEKERIAAKEAAEKSVEKEVARLREELERAKSTIAGVQATEGQFVAEGLYLSAVEEKQQLLDELQQKTLELEKMKSEIFIYRQTIAELETENDEHVRDIESLQKTLDDERAAAEQHQVEHEKHLVDNQEELLELRDTVKRLEATVESNAVLIDELQTKSLEQQHAYERKCASEVELSERLAVLQAGGATNDKLAKGASAAATHLNTATANHTNAGAEPAAAAAAGQKKKVKKVKKKKTLAEQLSEDGEEQDVLRMAAAANPSGGNPATLPDMDPRASPAPESVEKLSYQNSASELERLQNENLNLKKTIEKLSREVEQLQNHNADFPNGGGAESELIRLRKELREAISTTEKMKQQRDQAKAECKRSRALTAGGSSMKEKELERELQHLRAELKVVADQLLPTKEKLSEYMAMADRIGITYPFSDEHQTLLAKKMRSIKRRSIL